MALAGRDIMLGEPGGELAMMAGDVSAYEETGVSFNDKISRAARGNRGNQVVRQ